MDDFDDQLNLPPGDLPFEALPPAKRCRQCFYVLDHLTTNRCPECGQAFDPNDPFAYTDKPPFIWWRYWLPGFLLTVGCGLATYLILIPFTGFGWSVTFGIPAVIGAMIGYSTRLGKWAGVALAWFVFLICLIGLFMGGFAGVFCMLILLALAAIPLCLSVMFGAILRDFLKHSNWSQRKWLPVLLLIAMPPAIAFVELRVRPMDRVIVRTSWMIDAPLQESWDSLMFYEEVDHEAPWLLRWGLRTPVRTVGSVAHVGDRKMCIYTRGHLVKQVTARRPLESLEFAVVEQEMFEDYSVRLTRGSFQFERIDANHTRVTLMTEYQPLLHPRFAWEPVEEHVVHLLHQHVLEGMRINAHRRMAQAAAVR